ncbi:lysylphosphatidylglycerol synthase transmembrane domain-containing protein [Pseudonocardia benzenivorans]|uniref:Lysylphosphatidylglycerol synthase transmembrane domain-containing protein n=1 Tax=Pseudonocardia benzenivorans TaxID=228005 RepID=A0ABW3VSX3_9PSEU
MTVAVAAPAHPVTAPARFAILRRHAGALGGIVVLAVVAWQFGAGPLLDGLRALSPQVVLVALATGLVTTACNAGRWRLVAGGLGLPLRFRPALADCYQATFLNSVLPTGVLGDVGRAVGHGRAIGAVARSARAVVLERSAGQVVLVVIGSAVLLTRPDAFSVLLPGRAAVEIVGALAVAGAAVVLAVPRLRSAVATLLADARTGLLAPRIWPGAFGLSAVALAANVTLFVVAARATGATAPVGQLLPVVLVALFASGLPIGIGGFGPREAVAALGFCAAGLPAADGASASIVYGLLTFASTVPGALVLLARRGRAAAATGHTAG